MLSSRPTRREDILSRPRGHSLSRQLSPKKHKAAAPFAFWFPGLSADHVTLVPGLQGPTLSRGEPSVLSDPKDPGCFLAELIRGVHQCPPLRPRHTSFDGWKVLCGGRRPAWALLSERQQETPERGPWRLAVVETAHSEPGAGPSCLSFSSVAAVSTVLSPLWMTAHVPRAAPPRRTTGWEPSILLQDVVGSDGMSSCGVFLLQEQSSRQVWRRFPRGKEIGSWLPAGASAAAGPRA